MGRLLTSALLTEALGCRWLFTGNDQSLLFNYKLASMKVANGNQGKSLRWPHYDTHNNSLWESKWDDGFAVGIQSLTDWEAHEMQNTFLELR